MGGIAFNLSIGSDDRSGVRHCCVMETSLPWLRSKSPFLVTFLAASCAAYTNFCSALIVNLSCNCIFWELRVRDGVGSVVEEHPSELISWVSGTSLLRMCDLGVLILMALLNIPHLG